MEIDETRQPNSRKDAVQLRYQEIILEWDVEKNGPPDAPENKGQFKKRFWWICPKGHSYQSNLNQRLYASQGCPYCAGQKVMKGFNDLATLCPELAKEWHPTKNGDLTPDQVTPGANRKVWWRCELGHEFQQVISDRRRRGDRCPYCAGKKLLPGFNDVASLFPDLAAEWDTEKNGDLKPSQVGPSEKRSVWWRCPRGHSYETKIYIRTDRRALENRGNGCPYCMNRRLLPGFNDLETVSPDLVSEWHPFYNGDLTPREVITGSNTKFWWQCAFGHSWQTSVAHRQAGQNCPVCTRLAAAAKKKRTWQEKRERKYAAIVSERQKAAAAKSGQLLPAPSANTPKDILSVPLQGTG